MIYDREYRGFLIRVYKDDFDHGDQYEFFLRDSKSEYTNTFEEAQNVIDEFIRNRDGVKEDVPLTDSNKRWLYTGLLTGFAAGMFVMYQMLN
jgi:hypothetical protein